jgi:hypothetical protein
VVPWVGDGGVPEAARQQLPRYNPLHSHRTYLFFLFSPTFFPTFAPPFFLPFVLPFFGSIVFVQRIFSSGSKLLCSSNAQGSVAAGVPMICACARVTNMRHAADTYANAHTRHMRIRITRMRIRRSHTHTCQLHTPTSM